MALVATEKTQMSEEEAFSLAMVLTTGAVPAMVLNAAIELDVLEIIKKAGPEAQLSATAIAAELPTKNPNAATMLDRMLRLLASYSILTYSLQNQPGGSVERLYGLGPVCQFLTKDEEGLTLASHSLFCHLKPTMECWYYLKDAVLEGFTPFYKIYGTSPYSVYGKDPKSNKIFNEAMAGQATMTMKRLLENYKGFESLSTLVDVGGGTGRAINMIVSKYPKIKGINFDLPHVVNSAPTYPGVTHVGGDMFESVPNGGDAIFMKTVCHDWDNEHCQKLLKNCYAALPDHGKVIICEYLLPVAPEADTTSRMSFHFDVLMMVGPNGRERTEPEFRALAKGAGFEGFKVACSAYDFKVMEFFKKN